MNSKKRMKERKAKREKERETRLQITRENVRTMYSCLDMQKDDISLNEFWGFVMMSAKALEKHGSVNVVSARLLAAAIIVTESDTLLSSTDVTAILNKMDFTPDKIKSA